MTFPIYHYFPWKLTHADDYPSLQLFPLKTGTDDYPSLQLFP